jgi:6-phosphogluconolactonase (cycloisomerase 2 family)
MPNAVTPLGRKATRRVAGAAGAALAVGLTSRTGVAWADNLHAGAVYTLTNAPGGNAVAIFYRAADGTLSPGGTVATGGAGTGSGLGSQGALALSHSGQWLYAVNAGSNSISVLRVTNTGLKVVQVVPSGGALPISLTVYDHLLYALNAGGAGNIAGFVVQPNGTLAPLAGSTRGLGGPATGPAQVSFTPDGTALVVTEKSANAIVTYAVSGDGLAGQPVSHPSSGAVPFGFDFARDTLVVSEAAGGAGGHSAVSSYAVSRTGGLQTVSPSVPDFQNAACWLVATENGRYAYTANAASDSISGYHVDADGRLTLLTAGGLTAYTGAGSHPTDMALTNGSRYLYVLGAATGRIVGFAVNPDGSLTPLGSAAGIPTSAAGLAAR